eukprot:255405-Prymnesium_polylepis.2
MRRWSFVPLSETRRFVALHTLGPSRFPTRTLACVLPRLVCAACVPTRGVGRVGGTCAESVRAWRAPPTIVLCGWCSFDITPFANLLHHEPNPDQTATSYWTPKDALREGWKAVESDEIGFRMDGCIHPTSFHPIIWPSKH